MDFPNRSGVNTVCSVELDTAPIDKPSPLPACCPSHGVVFEGHPGVAFGDTTRTWIQSNCDCLLSNVGSVRAELDGGSHDVAVIHVDPRLELDWIRPFGVADRQRLQVSFVDFGIGLGIRVFQKLFTNVMDDVILLLRNHPFLRQHQTGSMSQCFVD